MILIHEAMIRYVTVTLNLLRYDTKPYDAISIHKDSTLYNITEAIHFGISLINKRPTKFRTWGTVKLRIMLCREGLHHLQIKI